MFLQQLLGKQSMIVVATHKQTYSLNSFFYETVRKPQDLWLSEYGAYLEDFREERIYGLMHYNCFLNFLSDKEEQVSFVLRKPVTDQMYQTYANMSVWLDSTEKVILANPHITGCSNWDQFVSCHRDLEQALFEACKLYKLYTGTDAEHKLRYGYELYYRNIVLGSSKLISNWLFIARTIVNDMRQWNISTTHDRWGGYILERLFSVHFEPHKSSTKPLVYFR